MKREPLVKDKVIEFIDDYSNLLLRNKVLSGSILDKIFFNHSELNCVCENIFKQHIEENCKCNNMKTYSSQGRSGASIHSIECTLDDSSKFYNTKHENTNTEKQVLKAVKLNSYYIKLRQETNKYMFLELDGFTIQTLINTYVYKELPNNTINIVHSGICKKDGKLISNKYGYNLMAEADLGSGRIFFNDILDNKYDKEFNIQNSDDRYKVVVNFLLQCVLIIGHLQSSPLEFFHGDYKPDNVFVKRIPKEGHNSISYYKFNVFGHNIRVKNMGFAVVIADFDKSSISLKGSRYKKQYRIVSPIQFKTLLSSYVDNIITNYGDIDPDKLTNDIYIKKLFISKLIPHNIDPTITILRSAGVKLYRDFDLYTFLIKLLDTAKIKDFIIEKKLDQTIFGFASTNFRRKLLSRAPKTISLNESGYITIDILNKIKEPMHPVFNDNYIKSLDILNYRLFK